MIRKKKPAGAPKGNKNAIGNAGGAPTKYIKEYARQAERLCLLGATDIELASFFEVGERTINDWKKKHVEFLQALKRGKDYADAIVAEKLFQRATGYTHPDIDIRVIRGKVRKIDLIKHYPPDTVAAIFWLKNRKKEKWRDRHEFEIDYSKLTDSQLDYVIDRLKKTALSE
ncbi:MAG: hypothetical protein JWM28_2052 [Chitinophagaceae bacterium]|nr:hypothetical protein [Chitinophagaceae bacterium]